MYPASFIHIRLEILDGENKDLTRRNDFLQRNCRNNGDTTSERAAAPTVAVSATDPDSTTVQAEGGAKVSRDSDSGISLQNPASPPPPPPPSMDYVAYVDLKRKHVALQKRFEETESEMNKRDKCIATLKSLLTKLRPGVDADAASVLPHTDTPANYVPLLTDDDDEDNNAPSSTTTKPASIKDDSKRVTAKLRNDLEEGKARIDALTKMLNMTVDEGDHHPGVDDVASVTKKWKHKVYQLLTQLSLKDVEMRRLETTLEMASAGTSTLIIPNDDHHHAAGSAPISRDLQNVEDEVVR